MVKTLVIQYTPRGERSNTKKLLDHFLEKVKGKSDVEIVDLTQDVPDNFLVENLSVYYRRNYGGEEVSKEDEKLMEKMDRMTNQLKDADVVVVAFPMFNFSLPAIVKAWFDSVMLKGETWDMGGSGFKGLMHGKKALVIGTSGGVYEGEWSSNEHAFSLAKAEFVFMGYDSVKTVVGQGLNMMPEKKDAILDKSMEEIDEVVEEFY